MATLLKVLDNLADIKSAGGVALGLGTQEVTLSVSLPTKTKSRQRAPPKRSRQ
jgi:hypothetical protein